MVSLILMKTTKQSTADPLFFKVLSTLNESQKRWYVAREAINYGRGGIKITHELTGISRPTIIKGMQELKSKKELQTDMRIRSVGGGRKNISETVPEFEKLLKKIMDEITAGDPMSLLRWTNKSVEGITGLVKKKGCNVSRETVRRKLLDLDYSLQSNFKSKEGFAPEDRNEQFEYINSQIKKFIRRGDAVLSIDAKKKEKAGEFKNNGRSWHPKGKPTEVNVYDYP
ncbi:MAG TPA: ISAzo13 family transposase, partial [Nitrospirae bacterium]|nr:ISAzo13 family transposase [Nitrospirota bacterium]